MTKNPIKTQNLTFSELPYLADKKYCKLYIIALDEKSAAALYQEL